MGSGLTSHSAVVKRLAGMTSKTRVAVAENLSAAARR
jgi:hypothetical protein